jgi:two-component system, OmpR family, response regulator
MRILLVEDEPEMASILNNVLGRHGIVADISHTLLQAQQALLLDVHDLILLDRRLPDGDGLDLIAKARARQPDLPIIVLTGRDAIADRVEGLDRGADDYLIKPFAVEELLARIRAVGRRPAQAGIPDARVGALLFDFNAREARVGNQMLQLPRRQLLVLECLCMRSGRTVTREFLLERVYGFDDHIQSNALEAHVSKLRRALDQAEAGVEIRVIRGVGYLLMEATA